jgi:hypothetical protein
VQSLSPENPAHNAYKVAAALFNHEKRDDTYVHAFGFFTHWYHDQYVLRVLVSHVSTSPRNF